MMNCGDPLPPYWSLLHDDAGNGVTAACLLDLPAAVATTASVAAAASTAASPMRFFNLPSSFVTPGQRVTESMRTGRRLFKPYAAGIVGNPGSPTHPLLQAVAVVRAVAEP